jgi:hypothetical protein
MIPNITALPPPALQGHLPLVIVNALAASFRLHTVYTSSRERCSKLLCPEDALTQVLLAPISGD